MKRFWVALPILLALIIVLILIPKTAPSSLDAARTRWEARPFTKYRMLVRYYDNSGTCTQDISVEGNEVIDVHNSTTCNTPLNDIEYPTVNDIFNYLQVRSEDIEAERLCETDECECDVPIGAVGRYHDLGYPRYVEVRPIYEAGRRSGLIYTGGSSCAFYNYEWSSLEIVSVTPE